MRKVYKGVNLRDVKTRKDLSDNLEDVFKCFARRVCDKSSRTLTVIPLSTHRKECKSENDYSKYEV